jgi:TetR/AcrR family transcriptional regulator, tetracycline repressor protein
VLTSFVLGTLALEAIDLDDATRLLSEEDRIAARRQALAAVPADRYPHTAAAADAIARRISTEQYRWGLHRVLDGITATAREVAEDRT